MEVGPMNDYCTQKIQDSVSNFQLKMVFDSQAEGRPCLA